MTEDEMADAVDRWFDRNEPDADDSDRRAAYEELASRRQELDPFWDEPEDEEDELPF